MQIIIHGYPKTFERSDLYAKADRLCMAGMHDEGRLLRALLDDYAPAAAREHKDEAADLQKNLEEAKEEVSSLEATLDLKEDRLDRAEEAVREALEAVQKALAYKYEKDAPKAAAELARAVGALSSVLR